MANPFPTMISRLIMASYMPGDVYMDLYLYSPTQRGDGSAFYLLILTMLEEWTETNDGGWILSGYTVVLKYTKRGCFDVSVSPKIGIN
ncbi:hypothetical protein CDAR_482701 [Caerostris darwini]|uniref:Uncharacterized protein n=1 Tax=Caerostris darwini TaxID=1538125 RepID=A0AAV4RJI5_9ARAC|nr:hypothetical protein CDAR_482701 [Caerostris darwini]